MVLFKNYELPYKLYFIPYSFPSPFFVSMSSRVPPPFPNKSVFVTYILYFSD